MLKLDELKQIAKERLAEADILCQNKKFDGAVYLCGYAVELGLKARICETLRWTEFPDLREYQSLKTHDLDILLHFSGYENPVKETNLSEWYAVAVWNSAIRFRPVGSAKEVETAEMIASARKVLRTLRVL